MGVAAANEMKFMQRLFLGMGSANERRRYNVGWAHNENDPCF